MDLPLEPALDTSGTLVDAEGRMAGRSPAEWNAAYVRVESYFHALRVRNRVLLGRLVLHVLKRAMDRAPFHPEFSATELAAWEMDRVVTEWFAEILEEPPTGTDQMLSTRGRLALLLADMPGKWQEQFLRSGPWPPQFVNAMRQAYLRAGPDFQLSQMAPRPLHLGPITMLTNFSRLPAARMAFAWLAFSLALILLFIFTH